MNRTHLFLIETQAHDESGLGPGLTSIIFRDGMGYFKPSQNQLFEL